MTVIVRRSVGLFFVVVLLVLAGCASKSLSRAPVEDRGAANSRATVGLDPRTQAVKQPPGFENAGLPGYYTVKPGDTMLRIGLETGQSYKDIVRWNSVDNPNKIEVGQVLRVVPPVTESAVVGKPVVASSAVSTPIAPGSSAKAAVLPAAADTPAVASGATTTGAAAEEMGWIWPSKGPILATFDEVKNKGVDIGGTAGDAVLASADGRVVYAGAGLRGYGNLIILKHDNTYLTAYAHNQTLLVKEDQSVKKGQKIAEMGNTDADQVKLHFEVRRQGKPVDPVKYLPVRQP